MPITNIIKFNNQVRLSNCRNIQRRSSHIGFNTMINQWRKTLMDRFIYLKFISGRHIWPHYCFSFHSFFLKRLKIVLKPSGIVSLFSLANKIGLNMSDVTSGHHQKWWVKKYKLQSFYSKPIWIYIVFSALMKSAHCTRHWRASFRVFVFKNNFQILAFQCFKSSFPVRIRVRRDPPHPLVCRQRQLNGVSFGWGQKNWGPVSQLLLD